MWMHDGWTKASAGSGRWRRERRSGGATFVVVMQTADVWDLDDRAASQRLRSPRDGSVLVQREMSSPLVIVAEVGRDRPTEAGLVEHDDVVQALAANGSDDPFDVRPLPRCVRCR